MAHTILTFQLLLGMRSRGLCGRISKGATSEENLECFVMFRPDEVRLLNSNAAEIKVLYIIP